MWRFSIPYGLGPISDSQSMNAWKKSWESESVTGQAVPLFDNTKQEQNKHEGSGIPETTQHRFEEILQKAWVKTKPGLGSIKVAKV